MYEIKFMIIVCFFSLLCDSKAEPWKRTKNFAGGLNLVPTICIVFQDILTYDSIFNGGNKEAIRGLGKFPKNLFFRFLRLFLFYLKN